MRFFIRQDASRPCSYLNTVNCCLSDLSAWNYKGINGSKTFGKENIFMGIACETVRGWGLRERPVINRCRKALKTFSIAAVNRLKSSDINTLGSVSRMRQTLRSLSLITSKMSEQNHKSAGDSANDNEAAIHRLCSAPAGWREHPLAKKINCLDVMYRGPHHRNPDWWRPPGFAVYP